LELAKAALHGNIQLTLKEAYEFVTAGEKGEEQTDKPVMGVPNHPLGDTYEEQEAAEEKIVDNIILYIRRMDRYDASEVIRNLLDPRQVSLNAATKIARLFITAHAKETILQELKDGNIKGTVPAMREIEVSHGYYSDKTKRTQPIGSYEFDVPSLVYWLTQHYQCRVIDSNLQKIIRECCKKYTER
jgi:hypothetical protein